SRRRPRRPCRAAAAAPRSCAASGRWRRRPREWDAGTCVHCSASSTRLRVSRWLRRAANPQAGMSLVLSNRQPEVARLIIRVEGRGDDVIDAVGLRHEDDPRIEIAAAVVIFGKLLELAVDES